MVDLEAVYANFDGITYAKGASVLRQLVAYVGREAFESGLAEHLREHAWGSATLADLLGALSRSSGRDLRPWAQVWLQLPGVTSVHARAEVGADGRYRSVVLVQEAATRPEGVPETLRPHRIAVGAYRRQAGRLVRVARAEVDLPGAQAAVPQLVGVPAADLLLVNDDDLTYVKARLDDRSLATVLAPNGVGALADSLPRALVWGALWEHVRDRRLAAQDFVAAALVNLDGERRAPAGEDRCHRCTPGGRAVRGSGAPRRSRRPTVRWHPGASGRRRARVGPPACPGHGARRGRVPARGAGPLGRPAHRRRPASRAAAGRRPAVGHRPAAGRTWSAVGGGHRAARSRGSDVEGRAGGGPGAGIPPGGRGQALSLGGGFEPRFDPQRRARRDHRRLRGPGDAARAADAVSHWRTPKTCRSPSPRRTPMQARAMASGLFPPIADWTIELADSMLARPTCPAASPGGGRGPLGGRAGAALPATVGRGAARRPADGRSQELRNGLNGPIVGQVDEASTNLEVALMSPHLSPTARRPTSRVGRRTVRRPRIAEGDRERQAGHR